MKYKKAIALGCAVLLALAAAEETVTGIRIQKAVRQAVQSLSVKQVRLQHRTQMKVLHQPQETMQKPAMHRIRLTIKQQKIKK